MRCSDCNVLSMACRNYWKKSINQALIIYSFFKQAHIRLFKIHEPEKSVMGAYLNYFMRKSLGEIVFFLIIYCLCVLWVLTKVIQY